MTIDELKQEWRKIFAAELKVYGVFLNEESPFLKAFQNTIDRIAALQPEPPKGREERVEEIRKMMWDASQKSPDGILVYSNVAEQIIATEPRVMSRKEIEKMVTEKLPLPIGADKKVIEATAFGARVAIDALVGQVSANNDEAWKKKYEGQLEHSRGLERALRKRNEKIIELNSAGFRLKQVPAKGPDRLDRIRELLKKVPNDEKDQCPQVWFFANLWGAVGYKGAECLCSFRSDENPEQVIAKYVAGLEKSSDLRSELGGLGDGYPELRKLAEEKLQGTNDVDVP